MKQAWMKRRKIELTDVRKNEEQEGVVLEV